MIEISVVEISTPEISTVEISTSLVEISELTNRFMTYENVAKMFWWWNPENEPKKHFLNQNFLVLEISTVDISPQKFRPSNFRLIP